ncbi:MAG TPA: hypothetical protein VME44_18785 [Streptosporangiaceae bacterium]|nr:hypothetical protein [Streptosporangiaceae bacterium]
MPVTKESAPAAEDLLAAAAGVIDAAASVGITMRLLGGVAVFHLASSARRPPLARSYHDFDVVVPARQGAAVARVFRQAGYAEDPHFNALHGAHRMIFASPSGFVVDVVIGAFRMCHELDLGRDLPPEGLTIHPADLLLTKLQIVQIEEKDLLDSVALLSDLPTDGTAPVIDIDRFVRPLAADWGFFHTVDMNIAKVLAFARDRLGSPAEEAVADRASRITAAMEAVPKTLKWKVRARAGERVPWYELPDEPEFRRPKSEQAK